MIFFSTRTALVFLVLTSAACLQAHEGSHGSVHDTVAGVVDRLKKQKTPDELVNLRVEAVQSFLSSDEREILGSEHVRFTVNVPVIVTILRDAALGAEPFWLSERSFISSGSKVKLEGREFDLWEKSFPAGHIGLGVHNLSGRGTHYLAVLKPQKASDKVEISNLYPAHLRIATLSPGVEPFVDQPVQLKTVPGELEGQVLIRMDTARSEDARLVSIFSKTTFPAKTNPDHVVLTWSGDPRTSQTIQWRTSTNQLSSYVKYSPASGANASGWPKTVEAESLQLSTHTLVNDPIVMRHTAVLKELEPGTRYTYSVGDGTENGWTEPRQFTTAPKGPEPFAFVYMGDAQNGLDRWGTLLKNAYKARPDAAFYLMAGDLVNRGAERWDWDSFFQHSEGVFDRRTLVPVIGNHECQGGNPILYLQQFALPRNGPRSIAAERAYSFEYSNAKFIILDSNLDPELQAEWLEQQLINTKAVWKFVAYHHPAYSSGGNRDNEHVRNIWTPIFDKYHVDLALQGHDHAYLRTYPMKNKERVTSAKDGTIYLISVSGTKFYDQPPRDYIEVGFTKVATYQVLDIQIEGNKLIYRSHDVDGKVRDHFVIEK